MYYPVLDELLVKYGATIVGYSVVAVPIFSTASYKNNSVKLLGLSHGELPFREIDYLESEIAASVTGDYVRNTQLLINLARYLLRQTSNKAPYS